MYTFLHGLNSASHLVLKQQLWSEYCISLKPPANVLTCVCTSLATNVNHASLSLSVINQLHHVRMYK